MEGKDSSSANFLNKSLGQNASATTGLLSNPSEPQNPVQEIKSPLPIHSESEIPLGSKSVTENIALKITSEDLQRVSDERAERTNWLSLLSPEEDTRRLSRFNEWMHAQQKPTNFATFKDAYLSLNDAEREAFLQWNTLQNEHVLSTNQSSEQEADVIHATPLELGTMTSPKLPIKFLDRLREIRDHAALLNPFSIHRIPRILREKLTDIDRIQYIPLSFDNIQHTQDLTEDKRRLLLAKFIDLVSQDFPGREVGVRGTVCSIDGDIRTSKGIMVKDISTVLQDGTEFDSHRFTQYGQEKPSIGNITLFGPEGHNIIWAVTHGMKNTKELRNKLPLGNSKKVYPVLLVYDLNALELRDGETPVAMSGRVRHTPFLRESVQPSSAILKAYVFDYMPLD